MERVLLFRIGTRSYACTLESVREVIPFRPVTRLPGAPPHVLGIINLRGALVTVIDLSIRLGQVPAAAAVRSIVIAEELGGVANGGRTVGLVVDGLRDVQMVTPEPAPEGDSPWLNQGLVRGIGHLGEEVIVILDVERLVGQSLQPRGVL
jgi:purine-binding chemotaxis protein CheW